MYIYICTRDRSVTAFLGSVRIWDLNVAKMREEEIETGEGLSSGLTRFTPRPRALPDVLTRRRVCVCGYNVEKQRVSFAFRSARARADIRQDIAILISRRENDARHGDLVESTRNVRKGTSRSELTTRFRGGARGACKRDGDMTNNN